MVRQSPAQMHAGDNCRAKAWPKQGARNRRRTTNSLAGIPLPHRLTLSPIPRFRIREWSASPASIRTTKNGPSRGEGGKIAQFPVGKAVRCRSFPAHSHPRLLGRWFAAERSLTGRFPVVSFCACGCVLLLRCFGAQTLRSLCSSLCLSVVSRRLLRRLPSPLAIRFPKGFPKSRNATVLNRSSSPPRRSEKLPRGRLGGPGALDHGLPLWRFLGPTFA